jgi:2-octaprenyl-6-methoxyphenol hydroxylase
MPAAGIDVLVRGAGPVGCVAAIALNQRGRSVKLLSEKSPAGSFRPIVLSYASRLILERIGVWHALEASAIDTIHVSQSGRFGRAVFDAGDAGVPALGYVVEYSRLLQVLHDAARDLFSVDEPAARCVVHAEGTARDAEEKRYSQDAVVASVRFDRAAGTTAFERFTREGPLALLPLAGRYALVWSMRPHTAKKVLALGEKPFLEELARAAGSRPGRPVEAEARFLQPLVLRTRPNRIGERAVYIGNAAQTLHPVAGQGLNVGLRDAWDLAEIARDAPDPGDAATLARFAARRRLDASAAVRVTDLLAQAFLRTSPLLLPLNAVALTALDIFPAARRFFARRMIFGPSALP